MINPIKKIKNKEMPFASLLLLILISSLAYSCLRNGSQVDSPAKEPPGTEETAGILSVSQTNPASNATGLVLNLSISATFDRDIDDATITTESFYLTESGAIDKISGEIKYKYRVATFYPAENLKAGTTYEATLTTAIRDTPGAALPANYSWSFTTGATLDETAPTVVSTSPANGATDVLLTVSINVTFSETMDAPTFTAQSFTLTAGVTIIDGGISYSGLSATFKPLSYLSPSTEYTATISSAVKDSAGNALAAPLSLTFTTGSNPPPPPACEPPIYDNNGINGYALEKVVSNNTVANPTDIAFIPGSSNKFLVTGQGGIVYYFSGSCDQKNTVDVTDTGSGGIGIVNGGEQGLLNIEFHPDYAANKYVFFYHTSINNEVNSVSRMTVDFDAQGNLLLLDPVKIIDFRKVNNASNHNGGGLVFAPDNTLLAAVGDGGSGNAANSQIDTNLLGTVIRITPEAGGGYTIPTGNMFGSGNPLCSNISASPNPCPEILAMGLRNPYRMSIDGNIIYLGDVGTNYEEIDSFNYTDNSFNFGWATYDGPAGQTGFTDPILAYMRTGTTAVQFRSEDPEGVATGSASIMIGDVYRGPQYGGELTGRLLHAEFYDGYMRGMGVDASGNKADDGMHIIHQSGISAMIQAPDGYIYIAANTSNMVYRLVKP